MADTKKADGSSEGYAGETTRLDWSASGEGCDGTQRRVPVLTVLAGNQMGRTALCDQHDLMLGRARQCDLFCSDSGVSRQHATVELTAAGSLVLRDLESTNGTYVNGEQVTERTLEDGDCIHLGPVAVVGFAYESIAEYELRLRQYEDSITDELTGIYNRRYLQLALRSEVAYALRYKDDLGFVMFDIDRFKTVNDTHGHRAGDEIIKLLTRAVAEQLRKEDILARYGGEEFTVLLRGLDAPQVYEFCERLRRLVASHRFSIGSVVLPLTISLGFSTLDTRHKGKPDALVAEADMHLYEAKAAGRNKTIGPADFERNRMP